MAENEMINMLIMSENIMGVYRNFSFLPKRRQVFILIRTVVEVILTIYLFCNRVSYLFAELTIDNFMRLDVFIFHFVVLFSSTIIILCGIQSSSNYKIFITKYMSVENFFQNEPTYTKCLKKLKKFFILASSIFLVICTINFMLKIIIKYYFQGAEFFLPNFMLMVIEIILEARFMLEHVVLYIYITMLQSYLKCINQFISYTQIKYDYIEKRLYKDRLKNNEVLPVEEVEQWAKMYECLAICSKNLSMCFKMQMRFALVFSSVHYVNSAYGIFCIILTKNKDKYVVGVNISYNLFIYIFCTYLVVCAGQKIVNEWSKTHRKLSKLYSTLSVEPAAPEMKSVMNLNLLVRVNLIKIEYTDKVHLAKYLIPIVLSLSLSYVITALQLNHLI